MRKRDEITKADTCMAHAHPDEMVFVLIGRDAAAPAAIRAWCEERIRLGKNAPTDPQITEAREAALIMEAEGRKWTDASRSVVAEVNAGQCLAWSLGKRCTITPHEHAGPHVFEAPTPAALWKQAEGDRDRYLALMKLHGHIIPKAKPAEAAPSAEPRTVAAAAQCDQIHDGLTCERPNGHRGEHKAMRFSALDGGTVPFTWETVA